MHYCKYCDYRTTIKCNYQKHTETRKHKKAVELYKTEKELNDEKVANDPMMTQNDPKKTQNDPKKTQNDPEKIANEPMKFVCQYCNKLFSTKAHLRRHELHRCNFRVNNSAFEKLKAENMAIKKEKKKLYKQIEKLLEKVGDTINNTTNTVNNNIILNNYGKEDLSHIGSEDFKNLIKAPVTMISELTKMIHFNGDKPENMNIFIPNKRDKYIKVYSDNEWRLEDKKERIPDIVDKNYNILDNEYENMEEDLEDLEKRRYKIIQEGIDNDELVDKNCKLVEMEILNGSKKHKAVKTI